jgi:hypothetical protein
MWHVKKKSFHLHIFSSTSSQLNQQYKNSMSFFFS